jgi:hypothetical protein
VFGDNEKGGRCSPAEERYLFHNEILPVEERLNDLLSRLTMEEKINQMRDGTNPCN